MALTPDEIRIWIVNKLDTSVEPNWADQNDISLYRGLHIKFDYQLEALKKMYKAKVPKIVQMYEDTLIEMVWYIKNFDIPTAELKEELKGSKSKVMRIVEKWLAVKREIEGREKGYFDRIPHGTNYYIDLNNGSDTSPHDGLKYGNYTADAGTNTTTLIETSELGRTTNDDWNGAYLYNVTRSIGVLITDSAYSGGTWTLTHPTITGQTSGDTYYIIDAWLTIQQYTSVTARTPGDIAKVRANTSQSKTDADINFDEDGNDENYIEIRGCSIADDPWGDASGVKPILSFGDTAYLLYGNADDYWKINRLVIKESADTFGNVYITNSDMWYFLDCEFTDHNTAAGYGIYLFSLYGVLLENCIFKDNLGRNIYVRKANIRLKNCTLDGGVSTTDYGLYAYLMAYVECVDCNFGQTTAHDTDDVYSHFFSTIKLRNCQLGTAGITVGRMSTIYEEDADGVYGAGKITEYHGTITKDTSIKTGSADFSCKMEPNANCGVNNPLTLNNDSLIHSFGAIKCTASVEKTLTVKIRSLGTWGTYPTNTELYIEASYYDSGSDAGRSTIKSTQVLSHASNWVDFTVTFTPLRDGDAYVNAYLKKFEDAGDGCYVNGEVT